VVLTPGADYETPGVHHAGRRRGRVAAGGRARAAAGDAGDRVRQRPITKRVDGSSCSLPPRAGGNRVCRRTESGDSVSLGGRSLSPIARARRGTRRPAGGRPRRGRGHRIGACCQVVLRYCPIAHQAWLSLVDAAASSRLTLHSLPRPTFDTPHQPAS